MAILKIKDENGNVTSVPVVKSLVVKEYVDAKPEQEKTVDIAENGTTEVTPDEGKVLSKVTVNTNVESGGSGTESSGDISKYCVQNEVSGTTIATCEYVNENEHEVEVQLSSDTITDFSGVEVKVCGKNLLNTNNLTEKTIYGITFTPVYKDSLLEYILVNGTASDGNVFYYMDIPNIDVLNANNSLILTGCPDGGGAATYIQIVSSSSGPGDTGNGFTLEQGQHLDARIAIRISNNATVTNLKFYPMVRLSTVVDSTYEPYVEKTIYTAKQDGAVDGVKSIAGTMNLICNTEGVNISAKYYERPNADYDRFWDEYQIYGTRRDYRYGFAGIGWNEKSFKPKYIINASDGIEGLFCRSDLKQLDLSGVIVSSSLLSGASMFDYSQAEQILNVPCEKLTNMNYMFRSCMSLHTITLNNVYSSCTYTGTFNNCENIVNLGLSGTIGNNFAMTQSFNLSNESVQNIIDCLQDKTGTSGKTLTLHADVKAAMTEEQIAAVTAKNWTLA